MDQDVSRLLSLVSHEVRAPLGVVRGYLRLLEQRGADLQEAHRHAVAAALKACDRAADILGQVSTLAQLHRRDTPLSLRPTPLEPLLRSAIHNVSMPPDPIVTVHVEAIREIAVAADPDLLRGAVAGLTSAVVRAQTTDCRVFLQARAEEHDGRPGVRLAIAPADALGGEVDEPPLDVSRGGLGLDLPIAAWVVHAHHGWLREIHNHNRFTGIVVWLPRA